MEPVKHKPPKVSRELPQPAADRGRHILKQKTNLATVTRGGNGGPRASHGQFFMKVDVPASAWGKIIGKGGETLKRLQEEFGVRIVVPRADSKAEATVTVRGPPAACEACAQHMHVIVEGMSRGKTKAATQGKTKSAAKQKHQGHLLWPTTCQVCKSHISSICNAFDHLGSNGHLKMVKCGIDTTLLLSNPPGDGSIVGVVELLEKSRDFHTQLGFDVDALTAQAPAMQQLFLAKQALRDEIARLPAIFDWIRVEQRFNSAWDESPLSGRTLSILEAPPFDELCARCLVGEKPPLIREPGLPALLPKPNPSGRQQRALKAKHQFPYDVDSSRLGIAVLHMHGMTLDALDVICGTSLIKALSGDSGRCSDTYFLQRMMGAVCCLHVPKRYYDQNDAGHAVEQLLCGSDSKRPRSFFTSSRVRIGSRSVLITSEVDGRDADGDVVEIKSSSSKSGPLKEGVALQVACNGSQHVLCCTLDNDRSQVLKIEKKPSIELLARHRRSFICNGQRVSLLLERICSHEYFEVDSGHVIQLSFDDTKEPVLEPAPANVTVLPLGLPFQ